ncbi:MAG: hypothetical protein HN704_10295 [Bacteroidetes bacterium]|nr:hypothetical protein [Bacteroidota bacterium]MBT6687547.1 hypothetical protein [Bacteroidota bacterium]MBT7142778.1 hypothetical protein [Bacteroidota bacterium]MBT7491981.1 hypothetical protein [Bacteroidota bacterium]
MNFRKHILFLLVIYSMVVLHDLVPHHHHFDFYTEVEDCENECETNHHSDEHDHSTPDHCHAFNDIQFYDKSNVRHSDIKQIFVLVLLNEFQYFVLKNETIHKTLRLFVSYKPPELLRYFLRGPPQISIL